LSYRSVAGWRWVSLSLQIRVSKPDRPRF